MIQISPETQESATRGRPKDAIKREDIVSAATDLFMEKGFELTSMEAVARHAGVSKLTIYSHFSDKNELFKAIMQQRCEKLGMPASFMHEADKPIAEALTNIAKFATSIIFRTDSFRMTRVIHAEAMRHPEVVRAYFDAGPSRVKAAFADLLDEFNRQGQIKIDDPIRAAEQFFSLLKGERWQRCILLQAPIPDAAEMETHINATVRFFLAAYKNLTSPKTEIRS